MNEGIIFLEPVFKEMIWGGSKLKTEFGYDIPGDHTGECWAVSAHPNGDCIIKSGRYAGQSLSWLWREHAEMFQHDALEQFPLLVKIIDAKTDLSIQVHPNDAYAKVHENGSLGKTECWYILDCSKDATIVIGHNATSKEELVDMIEKERWKEFIREIPVHKGDFIQINPGTIHAIKGGIMLLEIQQNSDITYRIYDYHRLSNGKPRTLHIKESLDVITVPATKTKDCIRSVNIDLENTLQELISCIYYKVECLEVRGTYVLTNEEAFRIVSVIDGEGMVNCQPIKRGDHFLIMMSHQSYVLEGKMELILSCPNKKAFHMRKSIEKGENMHIQEIASVLFRGQEQGDLDIDEIIAKSGEKEVFIKNYKVIFPTDENIGYCGRIDVTDCYAPIFIYPCSSISVRFFGCNIKLLIRNKRWCWNNYLGFFLDGKEVKVMLSENDMECITIGEGLEEKEHELLIFKRMDSCHTFEFFGFVLDFYGRFLPPLPKPKRRIEVYGDSVSAGEVSEAISYCGLADPKHEGEYSNSYYSYAWMTARKLGAEIHDIAQGGIALLDGTGYFRYPNYRGIEHTYDLLHYNLDLGPDTVWDFTRYTPHVVIIAIGQNDNHPEDYMMQDYSGEKGLNWRKRYHSFIMKIREQYPNALLILTTTILCHHENWDRAIEEVCKDINDSKIKHFLYKRNGCGTRGHIRISEADEMSDELVTYINSYGEEIWM